jgi:DNA-binding response OmpR family regulator
MRLRRHLEEDARNPRLLQTVRGVGYRLSEE